MPSFQWPEGIETALSLSFDDGRPSQVENGFPLLEECGVRATFYVCPDAVEARLEDWQALHAAGHEIGNHTVSHPCSGNFDFCRDNALEDYDLDGIEGEILACNARIQNNFGMRPQTFAYPCGQTFVGRGVAVKSYVPVVAKHFFAGRGFPSEYHNAPAHCDLAQLNGVSLDQQRFEEILTRIDVARNDGGWLVLAGHDAGPQDAHQVCRTDMLRALCDHARDPKNRIWIDTVATIAQYVQGQRQ